MLPNRWTHWNFRQQNKGLILCKRSRHTYADQDKSDTLEKTFQDQNCYTIAFTYSMTTTPHSRIATLMICSAVAIAFLQKALSRFLHQSSSIPLHITSLVTAGEKIQWIVTASAPFTSLTTPPPSPFHAHTRVHAQTNAHAPSFHTHAPM